MGPLSGAVGLLERALGYTLGGLGAVTPEALSHPTPCRDWDLRALLHHMSDSLVALYEAIDDGRVALETSHETGRSTGVPGGLRGLGDPGDPGGLGDPGDPAMASRDHVRRVLGSWAGAGDEDRLVTIGGCPVLAGVVACVGAIEVAAHGWDVYQACGRPRPIPPALAADLLDIAPMFVTDGDRPVRFAVPIAVSPSAGADDRLVAFLGRDPG